MQTEGIRPPRCVTGDGPYGWNDMFVTLSWAEKLTNGKVHEWVDNPPMLCVTTLALCGQAAVTRIWLEENKALHALMMY